MENKNELILNAGDALQLQFYPLTASDREERYYVRVIGYLAGKSIIATAPVLDGRLMLLREHQQFTVRLISGNSVQAFMASLLKKTTTPYPYIHLSYPETLESITIRKAQRINTNIIASVQNLEPGKEAVKTRSSALNDLSSAGALVVATEDLGEVGDMLSISVKLTVAEKDEYLNISAIIRRCLDKAEPEDKNRYGVEFQIADEREKLVIHGFVYEQIARTMS
ncbi:hypothetical protein MNBD_GAMMA21-2311 [hydrothermal vent metagenome]|uniref:PilZ domain-containing protein n=1 Tax=hydrothermal vent metagenome TaxID=652676 RepID=A0A3B1B6Z4_9ZZZZ